MKEIHKLDRGDILNITEHLQAGLDKRGYYLLFNHDIRLNFKTSVATQAAITEFNEIIEFETKPKAFEHDATEIFVEETVKSENSEQKDIDIFEIENKAFETIFIKNAF